MLKKTYCAQLHGKAIIAAVGMYRVTLVCVCVCVCTCMYVYVRDCKYMIVLVYDWMSIHLKCLKIWL